MDNVIDLTPLVYQNVVGGFVPRVPRKASQPWALRFNAFGVNARYLSGKSFTALPSGQTGRYETLLPRVSHPVTTHTGSCTDIPFASAGQTTRAPARSPLSSASFSLGRRYSVAGSPPSGRQTARRRRKNSRSARAVVKQRASRQARSAAECRPRRKWSSPITACQPG